MAKHFCIFAIKSELDQILCGLSSTLGVLELFRYNPTVMRSLLVCSSVKITADSVYDTFSISFSPDGRLLRKLRSCSGSIFFKELNVCGVYDVLTIATSMTFQGQKDQF